MEPPVYSIKRVEFFGRTVKVCLQNINGPCPLLAIANVLSLRNELKLPSGASQIAQDKLITMVAEILLERNKHSDFSSDAAAYLHQNLADAFEVLQKLATGIDVNVKFHNVFAFESTKEVTVFDLLGIPLVHGWLVDPADRQLAGAVGTRSYNELVEVMLAGLEPAALQQLHASGSFTGRGGLALPPSNSSSAAAAAAAAAATAPPQPAEARAPSSSAAAAAAPVVEAPSGGHDSSGNTPASPSSAAAAAQQPSRVAPAPADDGEAVDSIIESILDGLITAMAAEAGSIQLGDSPTRSDSTNRRLAYEGAGPSRLNSSSSSSNGSSALPLAQRQQAAGPPPPPQQQQQLQASSPPGHRPEPAHPSSPPAAEQGDGAAGPAGHSCRPRSDATALLLQDFFEQHCSQLTPYGIASLQQQLRDHQLAVLFRNNHFSALFKYDDAVYLLMTDQGYAHEPDIVWERLDSVGGGSGFFTSAFAPFVPHAAPRPAAAGGPSSSYADDMDDATRLDAALAASLAHEQPQQHLTTLSEVEEADFALALQLQVQEEEALRERQAIIAQQEAAGRAQQQQQQQQQQRLQAGRGTGHERGSSAGGGAGAGRGGGGLGAALEDAKDKCSIM